MLVGLGSTVNRPRLKIYILINEMIVVFELIHASTSYNHVLHIYSFQEAEERNHGGY